MNSKFNKFVFVCALLFSAAVFAQEAPKTASVENEFIKIIVNQGPDSLGRFAIETTKGDPQNPKDDNQPLIFGRPLPWTSYTTIRIDDQIFVFGGENVKMMRRTGQSAQFGKVVSQNVTADSITTECEFMGEVRVAQHLFFVRNASTRVKDSAMISYEVTNRGAQAHKIGIRIMLDTKLGANDGAPFRIGNQAVDSELKFEKAALFDYWQAFDSLTSPNVIAQGTIKQEEEGVTAPDSMYLVNWGTLSDHPWDFDYVQGRSFIREGELEKDTSLALYWLPRNVESGKQFSVRTIYGLAGLSRAAGALSLGLTAPREVYATSKREILIVGYVSNTGGYDSQNTVARFDLPKGFRVTAGSAEEKIGLLRTGETRQLPIKIVPDNATPGTQHIRLRVTSSTLDSNSIQREIDVLGAPKIYAELIVPEQKTVSTNAFIEASVVVANHTKYPLDEIYASIQKTDNLDVPPFETNRKQLERLEPGESRVIQWKLRVKNPKIGKAEIAVQVGSPVAAASDYKAQIKVSEPGSDVSLRVSRKKIKVGDYFYVGFGALYSLAIKPGDFQISYDSGKLEFVRYSPDLWAIRKLPEPTFDVSQGAIAFSVPTANGSLPFQSIAKFHFRAVATGNVDVVLKKSGGVVKTLNISVLN